MLAYNIVNNEQGFTVTLMLDFKPHVVSSLNHRNIDAVITALRSGDKDKLRGLLTKENFTTYVEQAGLEFTDGVVTFRGEPLHNVVAQKVERFYRENIPHDYLLKFLENLMENPSEHSREQLYAFMERNDLPIDENGHFIAYKRLRHDYTSVNSGKGTVIYPDGSKEYNDVWHIPNNIGNVVKVDRDYVTNDPDVHCSYGLHLGSLGYVRSFGQRGDPIVICTVNPRDVVSVPNDCNATKIRACEYVVQAQFEEELKDQAYRKDADAFVTQKNQKDTPVGYDPKELVKNVLSERIKNIKYDRSQVYDSLNVMVVTLAKETGLSIPVIQKLVNGAEAFFGVPWAQGTIRRKAVAAFIAEL